MAGIQTIPTIQDYYTDLYRVIAINGDALTKNVVGRRLKHLADKFDMYLSGAETEELNDIKVGFEFILSLLDLIIVS